MKITRLDDCYWNNDDICVFWIKKDQFNEAEPFGQAGSKYIKKKENKNSVTFIRDVYKFKDAICLSKKMKRENLRWA